MPVILPVLVVPGVELPELFMPVVALPELFVPVAEPPVLFIPVLFIPVPFIPVPALPFCVLPVVPVALFWLPLSVFDEAPIAPVTGSAAKAGAAASNPNAQTEASRRPLSMFNSPMAFAAARRRAANSGGVVLADYNGSWGMVARRAHHIRLHDGNVIVPIAFA
jgi:hypothetical protein